MEITKTTFRGYAITVIFVGNAYFFHSDYAGTIAIARRVWDTYNEDNDNKVSRFTLEYGNDHLIGGSLGYRGAVPAIKRFISKSESKYIPHTVIYDSETYADLSNRQIRITCE